MAVSPIPFIFMVLIVLASSYAFFFAGGNSGSNPMATNDEHTVKVPAQSKGFFVFRPFKTWVLRHRVKIFVAACALNCTAVAIWARFGSGSYGKAVDFGRKFVAAKTEENNKELVKSAQKKYKDFIEFLSTEAKARTSEAQRKKLTAALDRAQKIIVADAVAFPTEKLSGATPPKNLEGVYRFVTEQLQETWTAVNKPFAVKVDLRT